MPMETVEKSWSGFAEAHVCSCETCRDSHKAAFYAGANAFMWNMQRITPKADGSVDVGAYIAASNRDFEAYFAEQKAKLPPGQNPLGCAKPH
jgi:hypothetical protein